MVKIRTELDWLGVVAKQHKDWIRIINSFGEYDYAEDLVQEFYITLYKYANKEKVIRNGIVSRGYCFFSSIIIKRKLIKLVLMIWNFPTKLRTIRRWMNK